MADEIPKIRLVILGSIRFEGLENAANDKLKGRLGER
jgi:hypothetical protein